MLNKFDGVLALFSFLEIFQRGSYEIATYAKEKSPPPPASSGGKWPISGLEKMHVPYAFSRADTDGFSLRNILTVAFCVCARPWEERRGTACVSARCNSVMPISCRF